jgi:hypothetical protein
MLDNRLCASCILGESVHDRSLWHVQMCGASTLEDIVPEMVQGTEHIATWTWNTGRDHLPPFKLKTSSD